MTGAVLRLSRVGALFFTISGMGIISFSLLNENHPSHCSRSFKDCYISAQHSIMPTTRFIITIIRAAGVTVRQTIVYPYTFFTSTITE